jgi:mercuric ion transport protein
MDLREIPSMTSVELGKSSTPEATAAPSTGLLAGTGTVVGLGALIASSCCVLPLALAGLGVTGAVFGGLAFLAEIRPLLLGGAAVMLALGWAFFFWRRASVCNVGGACAVPARSARTATLLGIGSFIVGLALVWEPYVEPVLLKFVR